jgi:hypothetical protein
MAARDVETGIDRLYQLPLNEFTAARNALAKESGGEGARIRALEKPSVPAWAVNQLYWKDRETWNALIAAAERLREVHRALLAGRKADLRAASEVHEKAVDAALSATLALLADSPHPATDATKHGIARTLRALPGTEAPGRLTAVVEPAGFEALAGLAIAGGTKRSPPARTPPPVAKPAEKAPASKADARALTRARETATAAERARREAEQAVRREEFDTAWRTREAERAASDVDAAREALAEAKARLDEAVAAASTAAKERDAAKKRARAAQTRLETAREEHDAAAAALRKLER